MRCLTPLKLKNPKIEDNCYNLHRLDDYNAYCRKYGDKGFIEVPCGKCEACIERKANDWSCRLYYEWLHAKTSAFFTLTYAEEFLTYQDVKLQKNWYSDIYKLPVLVKEDCQKFMKRLRKVLGNGLRFFLGGEYGETDGRPHYHVAIFDYPREFNDSIYDVVKQTWSFGQINVTENMCIQQLMYVAKYIYCSSLLPDKSFIYGIVKPFVLCSRRPGLGYQYFQNKEIVDFHNTYLNTMVRIDDGKKLGMPRYYRDKIFTDESKEKIFENWLNSPLAEPTYAEKEIFLNRFKKKKRGKSI